MVSRDGEKYRDNFGIELCASEAPNFLARMRHRNSIAIATAARHFVESIGDREDACPERNLFTAQATWIARTSLTFSVKVRLFPSAGDCPLLSLANDGAGRLALSARA